MMVTFIFNATVCPFAERKIHIVEQLNEIAIGLILCHLIGFCDIVTDAFHREILGLSLILTISITLVANLTYVLIDPAKELF